MKSDIIERFLYVTLAVVMAGTLALVLLLLSTNQKLDAQLKDDQARTQRATARTNQIISQIKTQSDAQTTYIRCIADFFAQPNRANMTLADLDSCQITKVGQPMSVITPTTSGEPALTAPFRTTPQAAPATPTSNPTQRTAPTPSPAPAPSRAPSLTQSLSNGLGSIIKSISGILHL